MSTMLNLFRHIADNGFTIHAEKCAFNMKQIEYLGYIVDNQDLRPNHEKIAVIHEMPAPRNVSEVRSIFVCLKNEGPSTPPRCAAEK